MTLHLLSPLDGRYSETTSPLRDYFSEFAFLRDRVRVELNFLLALSKTDLVHPLSDSESTQIESVIANFSDLTMQRTFGSALGHSLLAWTNFQRGLKRIVPDEEKSQSGVECPLGSRPRRCTNHPACGWKTRYYEYSSIQPNLAFAGSSS